MHINYWKCRVIAGRVLSERSRYIPTSHTKHAGTAIPTIHNLGRAPVQKFLETLALFWSPFEVLRKADGSHAATYFASYFPRDSGIIDSKP